MSCDHLLKRHYCTSSATRFHDCLHLTGTRVSGWLWQAGRPHHQSPVPSSESLVRPLDCPGTSTQGKMRNSQLSDASVAYMGKARPTGRITDTACWVQVFPVATLIACSSSPGPLPMLRRIRPTFQRYKRRLASPTLKCYFLVRQTILVQLVWSVPLTADCAVPCCR